MALKRLATAALAVSFLFSASDPAEAALADGGYSITGQFDDPRSTFTVSGGFDVINGIIENLAVSTDFPALGLGDPSMYSGSGVNEASGTMFSAILSLDNQRPGTTGSGFLSFATDGIFQCGGVDRSNDLQSIPDTCQINTSVFGTEADEQTGSYSIEAVSAAVPLPASLVLLLGALGGLGLIRKRAAA